MVYWINSKFSGKLQRGKGRRADEGAGRLAQWSTFDLPGCMILWNTLMTMEENLGRNTSMKQKARVRCERLRKSRIGVLEERCFF